MSAQVKPQWTNMSGSLDIPMSAFNKQLIEEAGKLSTSKGRVSRGQSDGSRGSRRTVRLFLNLGAQASKPNFVNQPKPHSRSASMSAISRHDSNRASMQQRTRRSMSEQQVGPTLRNHLDAPFTHLFCIVLCLAKDSLYSSNWS